MAISIKDRETLRYLVDLEKDISEEYVSLDDGAFSSSDLLSLLDKEEDLLNSIDLNEDVVGVIEKSVRNQIGARFHYEMPLGISTAMTDATYPYVRLLSRVRYKFKSLNEEELSHSSLCFQDLEVALLYRSLMCDSAVHTDITESLQKAARNVLVDSPQVERAVVSREMEPLDQIDDMVEFQANFTNMSQKKKADFKTTENEVICARAIRFALNYKEALDLLSKYSGLHKSGQDVSAEMMIYISFLKTIIATQTLEKREHVYKEFISSNAPAFKESAEYLAYIKHSVMDIETNLVPSIRKINFMNKPSI